MQENQTKYKLIPKSSNLTLQLASNHNSNQTTKKSELWALHLSITSSKPNCHKDERPIWLNITNFTCCFKLYIHKQSKSITFLPISYYQYIM